MDDIMKNKRLMKLTVEHLGKMSEEIIKIDKEIQIQSNEIKILKENDKVLDYRIKRLESCKFIDLRI